MSTRFADAHGGSGYHPMIISDRGGHDHDRSFGWGWIFALVIIFLALVFLWGRREHHGGGELKGMAEAMIPIMTASAMHNQLPRQTPYPVEGYGHYNHIDGLRREHWDIERDSMTQFGVLKQLTTEQNWRISDAIKDSQHSADMQFASLSKQAAVDTGLIIASQKEETQKVLSQMAEERARRLELENQRLYTEASQLRFHHAGPRVFPGGPMDPGYYAAG